MEDLAAFIIIGLLSRIIGMILRTTIIITGTTILLLLCAGLLVVYSLWMLAPVVMIGSLYYGLVLMFS